MYCKSHVVHLEVTFTFQIIYSVPSKEMHNHWEVGGGGQRGMPPGKWVNTLLYVLFLYAFDFFFIVITEASHVCGHYPNPIIEKEIWGT